MFDHALEALIVLVLPSLVVAIAILALAVLVFGVKQAPLGSALALAAGVGVGLWARVLAPSIKAMIDGDTEWSDLPSLALEAIQAAPRLMPDPAWNRLIWMALAALWIGRIARMPEMDQGVSWALRAATSAATAWLVLPGYVREEFDWLAPVFAAVVFALWALLERLAEESPGGGLPSLLALTFLVAGVVLIHAAIASFLEVAVIFAAAFAGMSIIAAWRRFNVSGAMPAAAVMLPGLLLMGQRNSEVVKLSWWVYALPVFAPLLLVEALPLKHWPGVRLFLVRFLLVLIPLAAAIFIAHYQVGPLDLGNPVEGNPNRDAE